MSRNPPQAPPRRDFIGKPAPPGYVAGVGRGATGFTTRSDIGPAREVVPVASSSASEDGAGPSRKATALAKRNDDDDDDYLNESNYDQFAGYGGSLFNKDPYEQDDEEADKIYDAIDKHLDERGKALREAKARQELEAYRQKRPKLQQQFVGLKHDLKSVSESEWMNIPDVGDARNRKQRVARQDKFTPIPDSLIAHQARIASGGERLVYVDTKAMGALDDDDADDNDNQTLLGPDQKPLLPLEDGRGLNIGDMSDFRSSYMSMRLSRVSNSASADANQATNPQDYLTNLQSMVSNQITNTATLNEYRKQFASLRTSNPTFQNAWIASARLEEAAGKLKAARSIILAGCEKCPKSADLWLEAIRMHPQDMAKRLALEAIKKNSESIKLWIKAAELETDDERRRRVYELARQRVPKSALLWKKSVELESPEQARGVLKEAVRCCPDAVELWLALAKLQPYEEAKQVLVEAAEKNPTSRSIWITAAKLEEQVGNNEVVAILIKRSIEEMAEKGVEIKRQEWLREAIDADRSNFKTTCREIIKRVIGWNMEESSRLTTWMEDVRQFVADKSIDCARAVFMAIVEDRTYRKMESVWLEYANFEWQHGSSESVANVLKRAVSSGCCPKSETLSLMLAKETKQNLDDCRQILSDALDSNPDSEKIVLAAVELECENGNYKEARRILADACLSAKTPQLVMRAANLESSLGNLDEAVRILKAGVEEYKNCPEFYSSLGQVEEQKGDIERAKSWYQSGLKFNPTSVPLWISRAHLEERTGFISKARSQLEMARLRNPKVVQLWLESAKLELRVFLAKKGNQRLRPDAVTTILAKGIKECKDNPELEKLLELQADVNKGKYSQTC